MNKNIEEVPIMAAENAQIFVGNIIHCKEQRKIQVLENGYIITVGTKILAIGLEPTLHETKTKMYLHKNTPTRYLTKSQILIPGLIDTHLHAPQYPNCGLGYDKPLLDWLNDYTYPLEQKYKNTDFCKKVFDAVVKKTLSYGTTTACYFGSLFSEANRILVDTIIDQGQRALVGKVNMTMNAPESYLESNEMSLQSTLEFIKFVHEKKCDLVKPIITPRFALSVDMDLMLELGQIAKCKDIHIQSHISENKDEVDLVQAKFGMDYALVYDQANLLTPKTILAHAVYLSESEIKLLVRRGTSIAHCPDSNVCLKSGFCNIRKLWDLGVTVGLGTDISGGSTPSMIRAMKLALDCSIHVSMIRSKDYPPLSYEEAFYLATLGGSEALSMSDVVGNFEVYKDFDALIVDMDIQEGKDYFDELTPQEILQKFIYSGDDRNVVSVYVAGKQVK